MKTKENLHYIEDLIFGSHEGCVKWMALMVLNWLVRTCDEIVYVRK